MKKKRRRFKPVIKRQRGLRAHVATVLVFLSAAVGVIQFYRPDSALGRTPFAGMGSQDYNLGTASGNAFGRSGEVRLLFTMPGERIEFPLAIGGDPTAMRYEWTSLRGSETGFVSQVLEGAEISTPLLPGFYYLTLINGDDRQIIREPALAVMRPFQEKLGSMLNGYRIGTYLAEKFRGRQQEKDDHPDGFLEIYPQHLDLAITKHLRLRHFLTHDDQAGVWPKYVALNPRLLDKLELIFAELEARNGIGDTLQTQLDLDVHSGFRTPAHNNRVQSAARDSRHQYGDAADIVVDANGNGRLDRADHLKVVAAVEAVERTYPDLVGGLGIYASGKFSTPYVHIDARGKRSRWRG
ncbi:MAG: YcbK family protein [Gemmatimonadaceae bacterium]